MQYMLQYHFNQEVERYQKDLVNQLINEFLYKSDYPSPTFPAYCTLKTAFKMENLEVLQEALYDFSQKITHSPIFLKDIRFYSSTSIFLEVSLSDEAQIYYQDFLQLLQNIDTIELKKFEQPQLYFHCPITHRNPKQIKDLYKMVHFLQPRTRFLEDSFDNITIVEREDNDNNAENWEIIERFDF